jgi:hypothetical protein
MNIRLVRGVLLSAEVNQFDGRQLPGAECLCSLMDGPEHAHFLMSADASCGGNLRREV